MSGHDQVQKQPAADAWTPAVQASPAAHEPEGAAGGEGKDAAQCGPQDVGWKPRDKKEGLNDANTHATDVKTSAGTMQRLPLEGLKNVPGGRAIVVVPAALCAKACGDKPPAIEVLLHMHGYYRHGYHHLRDESVYQIEEQIAASGRATMIGVLPQGPTESEHHERHPVGDFDKKSRSPHVLNGQGLVDEVVKRLFSKTVPVQRTVLSGHSGGGFSAMETLQGDHPPEHLGALFLFDGINGPNELTAVKTLLRGRLDQALQRIKKLRADKKGEDEIAKDIQDTGFRFSGIYSNTAPYPTLYPKLASDPRPKDGVKGVYDWFAEHEADLGGAGGKVYKALRDNFYIASGVVKKPNLPGEDAHESVMAADKDLEKSLKALPPAGAPVQPKAASAASLMAHWAEMS